MRRPLIPMDAYTAFLQSVGCASQRQMRLFFTGQDDRGIRHVRTEKVTAKNKRQGAWIKAESSSGEVCYIVRRLCKGTHYHQLIDHYLGATECLVRLHRSDTQSFILPERQFYRLGSIPDGAVSFTRTMVLVEYHTLDNFSRHKPEQKDALYQQHLTTIEGHFGKQAVVLYVIDASPEEVMALAPKISSSSAYLVDYRTYKSVPIGHQLAAPIYLWGGGGQRSPLRQ